MKAVILARVSTKDQEDGHSLEAQIANLRLYADRKGMKITREYTIVESSTKGYRPEFMRMIDFIRGQKEKIAVIVDTVDRLQRSFRETPIFNDLLEKDLLELHFVKEGNVLCRDSNAFQKAMWNMSVMMAQSYTDSLSDNVKRSIKHKVSNGEWSGPAPLGYQNTVDPLTGKKTIIPDPERAFLIKKFFDEYATGAYSLNEMGRKMKGLGLRSHKGHPVWAQTLHTLVRNPFYYGVMKVKGTLHPHKYEPLISKELYDACQDVLSGRARVQAVRETRYPYILRGMLKCAVSGRIVSCDLKKGKHVYLISRDPSDPEKKIWTREADVLDQVRDVFRAIQIPEGVMQDILGQLKKSHDSEKEFHTASIEALNRENTLVTNRLDSLMEKYLDGGITKDMYDRTHSQLIQRRQEIQEMLERHHSGDEQFRIAVSTMILLASKAAEIFDRSETEEKRQLIGYVFSNLELKGSTLSYSLKKPFNLLVDLASCKEWLLEQGSNLRPID